MSPTEETTTKQRKHTRPVFWVLIGLFIAVPVISVFPRVRSAIGQYQSAKSQEAEAAKVLAKATVDKVEEIKKVGLPEYAKAAGKSEGQVPVDIDNQRVKEGEKQDKYYMDAQREQKEREDQLLRSWKIEEGLRNSTLPEYDIATIGSAFNAFFKDPKWEVKVAGNGATFVLFSGSLKNDMSPLSGGFTVELLGVVNSVDWRWKNGDIVRVKFAISSDSSSFELWSVQMGDGVEVRSSDWEKRQVVEILLEAIYRIE